MSQYNTYLMHYGVKGMKWGVRKAPNQVSGGRRTPSGKAELGESTNIAKQLSDRGSAHSKNLNRESSGSLKDFDKMLRRDAETAVRGNLTKKDAEAMLDIYIKLGDSTKDEQGKIIQQHNDLMSSIANRMLGPDASKVHKNVGDTGLNYITSIIDSLDMDDLYYVADGGNLNDLQHSDEINELYHHGVKGMKWGVRRTLEQLGYDRAQKGGVDERYINKAVKQAYSLNGKTNKNARQSKRQMRIEEELETYINTNRNSAKDAALSKAIAREQNRKPSALKQKLSDPEFQRKAATAAKIALVIGAAYATHKIINDPRILAAGKDAITKVAAKSGNVKASAIKNVMNSTEFKVAKAAIDKVDVGSIKDAAKAVGGATGKALKRLGSEDMRNTISGIGAMAGTTAIVRSQIKDFRENKPDGDRFDRAVKRTQQMSEIGENINTLARGPKGQSGSDTTSSTSNSSSSKSSSHSASIPGIEPSKKGVDKSSKEYNDLFKGESQANREHIKKLVNAGYDVDQIRKYKKEFDSQFDHSAVSNSSSRRGNLMQDSRTGKTVRTNKPLTIKDSKRISDYQKQHPNKSLEDALNDLDLLDKEYRHSAIARNGYYLAHSSVNTGWRMKRQ